MSAPTSEINVVLENMTNAVTRLDQANSNVHKLLEPVHTGVNSLRGQWTGDASTTYIAAMQKFDDEVDVILKSLLDLARAVDVAAVEYAKAHNLSTDEAEQANRALNDNFASIELPGF
ncbi:WXG100 family type VII secretion target [Crossiella cryophila]|nr:WXG100 family type VII secretion target [Crossiella cryophila]